MDVAYENTFFVGGGAHPQEQRVVAKRIMFGNLEGAVWRGRGGKDKKGIDYVQSDVRAFVIAGDWKARALEAGVWFGTVTEGGRMVMAAWRKEEVNATRHR